MMRKIDNEKEFIFNSKRLLDSYVKSAFVYAKNNKSREEIEIFNERLDKYNNIMLASDRYGEIDKFFTRITINFIKTVLFNKTGNEILEYAEKLYDEKYYALFSLVESASDEKEIKKILNYTNLICNSKKRVLERKKIKNNFNSY